MPRGKITSVVADKGFGFIKPTDGGEDLFFHGSTIDQPFDALAVGQDVDFEIDTSAPKPRASKVKIHGELIKKKPDRGRAGGRGKFERGRPTGGRGKFERGKPAGGRGRPGPEQRGGRSNRPPIVVTDGAPGTIASVRAEKGFGFIKPDDGGEDLFFHHSGVDVPLESLVPGQQVEFELDTSSDKPRAAKVALRGEILRSSSRRPAKGAPSNRPPIQIENGVPGTIAQVKPEKGFGFIHPDDDSEDLFFHHTSVDVALESLVPGQQVEFEVDDTADKPRAAKVALRGDILAKGTRPPNQIENGDKGVVASIVAEKGFGFIQPHDGGDEVFFHDSVSDRPLESLVSGQEVEFLYDQTIEKARAAIVAVRGEILTKAIANEQREETPVPNGRPGEITSVVLDKGFGFVRPRDGGEDLFFHNSTVDYPFELLVVGQRVEFAIDETSDKPRAKQVAVRGDILETPATRGRAPKYPRSRYENGFVTKMLWKTRQGFISPDAGGAELLFEQGDVTGDKKYTAFEIGDYVEFVRTGEVVRTKIDKAPTATAVKVVEKEIKKPPMKELPNNPKSRRKKPTWRR